MALTRYIEIKVDSAKAKSNVDSLDKSMVGLGQDADKASSSMSALSKAAAAVAAALSVSKVIAYADAWTVVSNKLSNSVKAHEDLADVTTRVFDVAQKTRSSIEATADLYAKLERSTKSLGLSTADLEEIVTTINQAFVVSGSSPEEAARAITQLGQAFDSGALFAEEFNSINESGNRLVRALSESLGLNVKQLKDLGSQGKLTNEVLISAFRQQASVIEGEYQKTIETFSQSTIVATQNLTKFIGESVLVQSSVAAFGDTMVLASENIETLIDIATSLAVIYAARLAPSVIASVTSITALIAAQTKATVTTNALGQRTVVATGYMNAFAVASRGASSVLALFGGPAGVAVIAASALIYFYTSAEDAEERVNRLTEEVDELKDSFRGLNEVQRQVEVSKIGTEMSSLRTRLIETNAQIEQISSSPFSTPGQLASIGRLKTEAKKLEDQLDSLSVKQQAVFASGLPSIENTTSTSTIKKKIEVTEDKKQSEPDLPDADYSARYLQSQVNQTQATAQELENRLALYTEYTTKINQLEQGSFQQSLLMVEADSFAKSSAAKLNYTNKIAELEEERALLLDNDRLTAEARQELQIQLDEQVILAAQEYEQTLTEVAESGAASRNAIKQQELSKQISTYSNYANAALSLESAFGSQSEKAQKKRRKAAVVIDTAAGIARAYAENNFYVATGMAAALAANGIAQIAAINSASSAPTSTVSSSVSSTASTEAAPTSTTVFDFRSRDGQFFTAQDVVDILSSVEGAVVINNSLGNAARVGEI